MRRLYGISLLVLFVVVPLSAQHEQFISVSDIHFDPFYDPSLLPQLEASDVSGWPAIFATSKITTPSPWGKDTNWPLLQSFLQDFSARAANAKFVVISGDFLSHNFSQDYQQYSANKNASSYQSFVTKTVWFLANQLRAAARNRPIFPVLGNNDSNCGDYMITPDSWFLKVFASAFEKSVGARTFVKQFSPGGYYAVKAPIPNTLIIGLNSVFFSTNYKNTCGSGTTDWGAEELQWLSKQLASAKKRRQRVWMLYHIPPGINVYSSTNSPTVCTTPVLMWKTQYNTTFNNLMQQYASTIPVSLAGHTHMDDFRVATPATPYAYIHITPAISPLFTNNPAYESMTYSPKTASLIDYTVFNLQLANATPQWSAEYSFGAAYKQPAYTPATINAVRNAIESDAATQALYMRYYTASNATSTTITPENFLGYWCGTGALSGDEFTSCYCAMTTDSPATPQQ